MDTINNVTLFDFVGDDIWTMSGKGGGKKKADYEVSLSLTEKDNAKNGRRVTITLRGRAYELTKQFNRVWVSSFSKMGSDKAILLKVTKSEKAKGSYALSRAAKSYDTTNIQLTPPKNDLPYYEDWKDGYYILNQLSDDVFFIQRSDKEV